MKTLTRWVLALSLGVAALPGAAQAQSILPPPKGENRLFMEPYAGVLFDNGARSGLSFNHAGPLFGVRFGALAGDRVRLLGDVGYAKVNDVAPSPLSVTGSHIDAQNFLATGGVEVEVVPGATSGTLSLQVGGLWRSLDERHGAPIANAGYRSQGVIAPGFGVRSSLNWRSELKLAFQDYIALDSPTRHTPVLALGISFR
jgi:hypothetical protein